MMRHLAIASLVTLLATGAAAQQRPIFDIDDFVDPGQHTGAVFASRLVAGSVWNDIDDYRPRHHGTDFLHLANSIYWSKFQFDYKRSEIRTGPQPPVQMCPCNPPIFFPTPPSAESTPAASPGGGRDTVQFAAYIPVPGRGGGGPIMLRFRLTAARQRIDSEATIANTPVVASGRSGHEQSFGFDGDTYLPFGDGIFGTLHFARTVRSNTFADRAQNELTYTNRFPGLLVRYRVLVRPLLTVGAVTNRGGTGLNVVNPAFEAFYRHPKTRVNVHLVYSPQSTRSGTGGWETHHQVALFADWGYVWLFKGASSSSTTPPRSP